MNFKLIPIFLCTFFAINIAFAQPSDATLKQKVRNEFKTSEIVSIELGKANLQKKWENHKYEYQWHKNYEISIKTEYPGVTAVYYGGIQYLKSGSSYTFDNMLTGGLDRYEGIPTPSNAELNAILKGGFDPVKFYKGFMLGYIVKAENNIELAADPKFKWVRLNELRCFVTTTYESKVSDIGDMAVKKATFEVILERSVDGINYDRKTATKLLYDGKWLPVQMWSEVGSEKIREYKISQEEQDAMNTLKELGAIQMAEEFRKTLVPLDLPTFIGGNHFMQYIHELLLEGDKDKITSLLYNMLPRNNFEEWSEVVLNRNGQDILDKALANLENYKRAFCINPEIKHIQSGQVSFYDRSKYRHNRISVFYENDRWYISDITYLVRSEDYAKYDASGEENCDGDLIFIDAEAEFAPGDEVGIFWGGNWRNDGVIVTSEMKNGGYTIKFGASGLTEWFYANDVREREKEEVIEYKVFSLREKVKARYNDVWYDGVIVHVDKESQEYMVEFPARNNATEWLKSNDIEPLEKASNSNNSGENNGENSAPKEEEKKKKKLNLRVPEIKL